MTFDTSHSTTLNAGHITAMCVTIQRQLGRVLLLSFCHHHHSFIHSENLYCASSRNFRYLRGCYLPKRIVPKRMYRAMHDSQMSPWNQELTLCSGAKYPKRCNTRQWEAEVTQVR